MSYLDAKDFVDRARAQSGTTAGTRVIPLDEIRAEAAVGAPGWHLAHLTGHLTELSGQGATASIAAATALVVEAQRQGEPGAWIGRVGVSFFPPDLADSGVDLAALVVVRAPDLAAVARAAETLLRSGSFGLVVLDLGADAALSMAIQGRLAGLAQRHDAVLLALTEKPTALPSMGSIVSLRAEAVRERRADGSGFRVTVRALKDKRRGPGWHQPLVVVPPPGLK